MANRLVVKVTCGTDDGERANQGLTVAAAGVTLCTQCAARRSLDESSVTPGIRIAGAATFVEEALRDGTQALVY